MNTDEALSAELDPKNLTHVKLPVFEGPLDLLLYLIKKEEIDIYDIPIERITSRYLEYLQMIKMLDLEVAGEYLVVASTLVYIKSRVLLPHDQRPPEDEAEEDDPRWELVRQLVEYKKYKDAAFELQQCLTRQENVHGRGRHLKPDLAADGSLPFDKVGLFDLLAVFQKVLARANQNEDLRDIFEDRFTVSDKIQFILGQMVDAQPSGVRGALHRWRDADRDRGDVPRGARTDSTQTDRRHAGWRLWPDRTGETGGVAV